MHPHDNFSAMNAASWFEPTAQPEALCTVLRWHVAELELGKPGRAQVVKQQRDRAPADAASLPGGVDHEAD